MEVLNSCKLYSRGGRVPASSVKLREILREIEVSIERLEVLEYEIKKEIGKCAVIGV